MSVKIKGSAGFYEAVCQECGRVIGSGSERCVLPTICLYCATQKEKGKEQDHEN